MNINIAKSQIFTFGVGTSEKARIDTLFGFEIGKLPARNLGVFLITTGLKAHDCRILEDKILNRVTSWSSKI